MGLSVLPLLLVGLYGMYSNTQTLRNVALENLTNDVRTVRERTGNFLSGVEGDLRMLRRSTVFRGLVRSLDGTSGKRFAGDVSSVTEELLAFASTKRIYYQISIINEDREELLRVEADNVVDSLSQFRAVAGEHLRSPYGTYYLLLEDSLHEDQIAFSPAEMMYHGNRQIPAVNFVMPLFGERKRVGTLIASVFAGNLFEVMEPRRNIGAEEKIVLVADDGHYLYQSELRNQWDKLIAMREVDNLQSKFPEPVCRTILSGNEGIIAQGIDEIIAYAPLFPSHPPMIGAQAPGFTESLFIFESVPAAAVMKPAWSFALTFAGFLVLFLFSSAMLGMLATSQFTRPIEAVERGAEIIAKGNYSHRLTVTTGDEIERLAGQFNAMAASLETHEREIAQHRIHLEEMVSHRTKELVDEKGKMQAILNNVPSAFVLLDSGFRIQTVSESFTSITGLKISDVRGLDCRSVLAKRGFCHENGHGPQRVAARVETHIDEFTDAGGGELFFEHTTIPIVEHGERTSVVMIITDISKRRRLEQQLIQSEKLMATGEMAAIIAHEFRNALTSIKMILQLQYESSHLKQDDRSSLSVALDSIYGMESIVRELLNFARPVPMEFHAEQIATIIEECISFAGLRIRRQAISLTKEIEPGLPPLAMDAQRLKEAIINIVLNAIQSIEGKPVHAPLEAISISAKRRTLTRTLTDFALSDVRRHAAVPGESAEGEIDIPRGTECVVVAISDSGPGIPRENFQRIFDPFFTTKTNGTGLGLPMVKRTVNAHGGIVTVESTVGSGTTFEIILPVPGVPPPPAKRSGNRGAA